VVLVVVAAFVLARVRPDRPNTPSKPFDSASKSANRKAGANDKVVMHVNGEPVTEAEFNSFMESAPEQQRMFYASPEGKRLLADELVKLKALEQEGRRLGVDKEPEIRSQIEALTAQIVAGKTLEKLVKKNMEQKIEAEFAKEKGTAKTLRHILLAYQGSAVPPKNGGQAPSPEQATQKAAALVARIRGGADFGEVARTESDDQQTAPRGGVLGAARPEQLPPDIAAVVNSLTPGAVSDPVKTEFGIHIFKVEAPSLEDMRPVLEQRIQRQVLEETVTKLQKAAKVDMEESFFGPAPKPAPQATPQPMGQPQGTPKSNG